MKIAGIILIIIQVISLIPSMVLNEDIFANGGANVIGRCLFGIVGIALLVIAWHKEK